MKNIEEHKALGDGVVYFKHAIMQGQRPFPTTEGQKVKVVIYDYGESEALPIEKVKQPGPTHFLNKVKVHILAIRDGTHAYTQGQEEGHVKLTHPPCCGCPPERHCYVIDERSCASKGHSVSWCQLWHYMNKQHGPISAGMKFVFFSDGAFKSHLTVHVLMWLALCKAMYCFHVFMVSGHTRSEADALVKSVGSALEGRNIYDVEGMMEAWSTAAQEGLDKPPSKRAFPIEFHCGKNSELGDMKPKMTECFYDLAPNILENYFVYYTDPNHPGEIGVCRSPGDVVNFDRLPLVGRKVAPIGRRAFRVNLLKCTVTEARMELSHVYEEAIPFPRKKYRKNKQDALDKLCAEGERTLMEHKYHYFYKKSYKAP